MDRERKKQQTRRLILKSANALFHEKGYSTATLEKQTVLRYFGSKGAIAPGFRLIVLEKFRDGPSGCGSPTNFG